METIELQSYRPKHQSSRALFVQAQNTTALDQTSRTQEPAPGPGWTSRGPYRNPGAILDPWRSTLISITEVFFPKSKELLLHQRPAGRRRKPQLGDSEIHSHVGLSMLLYMNSVYLLFWIPVVLAAIIIKYDGLSAQFRAVNLVLYAVLLLVELLRLYLGNLGNFREQVPEVALSWVLSVLCQTPLAVFLAFNETGGMRTSAEERGANIPLVLQLLLQIVVMRVAVSSLIRSKVAKMQLNDFDDVVTDHATALVLDDDGSGGVGMATGSSQRDPVPGSLLTSRVRQQATVYTNAYSSTMTSATSSVGEARRLNAAAAAAAPLPGGVGD